MNDMRFDKKVSVVTGSTSGIGKAIARRLAELGSSVVVSGRSAERGEAVIQQIRDAGGTAEFRRADMMVPEDCAGLIDFAKEHYGRIDVLVNNAAISTRANIEQTTLDIWNNVIDTDLRAPFLCMQRAAKYMIEQGDGGVVINVGSMNAYCGEPKLFAYSAAKGGLMTMTRNAASQLMFHKIRVNQVNVGWTETEGEHEYKRLEGKGPDWLEEGSKLMPFGRLLTPEECAKAVCYAASDAAVMMNGSVIDFTQIPRGYKGDW